MANRSPTFGALVIASLAAVVGSKYLVGGALALIDDSMVSSILVMDSIGLSLGSGLLLWVVAGAFYEGIGWARPLGILSFLVVAGLSIPALRAVDPVIVTETVGMGLATLYLFVRSPFETKQVANVDESDSASRVGSTLR